VALTTKKSHVLHLPEPKIARGRHRRAVKTGKSGPLNVNGSPLYVCEAAISCFQSIVSCFQIVLPTDAETILHYDDCDEFALLRKEMRRSLFRDATSSVCAEWGQWRRRRRFPKYGTCKQKWDKNVQKWRVKKASV
jgi:hypothetical protein